MKNLKLLFLLLILSVPAAAFDLKSGQDVIAAMRKKYDGKWYKTLTFEQKTTNYKPDGTSEASTWYEAMSVPGKLRIDFTPLAKHDGIIFADQKLYSFHDGKLAVSRPFVHPLLVLGFDVYIQPVEATLDQLKGELIDMSSVHVEKWQGKDVYVVGAKQGDLTVPQFWVTKDTMVFVRLFELAGKDKKSIHETQFNNYQKTKKGWVSAEVKFFVDGKIATMEEYTKIKTDVALSPDLWNSEKWTTTDLSYIPK